MAHDAKYDEKVDVSSENQELSRQNTFEIGHVDNVDQLQRHLGNRQVQLIAISGSIGTSIFVSIAFGLLKGGPLSLLLAFTIYSGFIFLVTNAMSEMGTYMPISGGFIRMASHWVDESLGFWVGWNFFFYMAVCIPFEITALNFVFHFWSDKIPVEAVCATCIVLYFLINAFMVKWYGEAEFWLSLGKVFLILIVYSFTFITMVGGNPKRDAYGFRHWHKPGPFAEYITTGPLGRFEGFLACFWAAAFAVCGPEFVSMLAGEVKLPRRYLKNGYKTTYLRIAIMFIGSALCVGIVIPYNDPTLLDIVSGKSAGAGTAAASPYVIAMGNLGVTGLPHLTNALLCTSIFSAGNAYTYYGARSLYALALEGHAPKFLRKCTKAGVPMYCLCVTIMFPFLGFLNVSNGSAKVLTWLTNIITGAQIINYIVMCITYICFERACRAQNVDRRNFPYYARFQPWSTWVALVFLICVVTCYGYPVFLPGRWSLDTFFTFYLMVLIAPVLFFGWKFFKKTKFIKPLEVDLVWQKPIIDAYEENFNEEVTGFWQEIGQLLLCGKKIKSKSKA